MKKNIVAGLDIGTSVIRIAVTEQKNGEEPPRLLLLHKSPSSGIKNGYVVDFDDAVSSISKCVIGAEKKAGVAIKQVYLGIGGISLGSAKSKGMAIISRADGEIGEYDLKRAISQSEENLSSIINRNIIYSSPTSYKIDGAPALGRPIGMKGKKLEVETLFITALTQHLNDIVKVVEEAGLIVNDVIASPIAESAVVLTKQQKNAGAVLANIGSETVSIIVFEEGMPISLEVFPIGSSHITHDIALGIRIPLEEAEEIKLGFGTENFSLPRKQLANIIEARLHDIFELIESHLKKIGRNRLLPAGIMFTGSGSKLAKLENLAREALHLPTKIVTAEFKNNPQNKPASAPKSLEWGFAKEDGFSVAYGLSIEGQNGNKAGGFSSNFFRNIKTSLTRLFRSFLP